MVFFVAAVVFHYTDSPQDRRLGQPAAQRKAGGMRLAGAVVRRDFRRDLYRFHLSRAELS